MKRMFNFLGFKTENSMINAQLEDSRPFDIKIPMQPGELVCMGKVESHTGIITEQDPSGRPLNSPGTKADAGKLRPWLVLGQFSRALELVAEVGTLGANKYTDNGWVEVPNGIDRYMEGFGRHMLKLGKGEVYDIGKGGIGTKHKAQMIWNLLASLELEEREESIDKA